MKTLGLKCESLFADDDDVIEIYPVDDRTMSITCMEGGEKAEIHLHVAKLVQLRNYINEFLKGK
jgi:hypothetical protein